MFSLKKLLLTSRYEVTVTFNFLVTPVISIFYPFGHKKTAYIGKRLIFILVENLIIKSVYLVIGQIKLNTIVQPASAIRTQALCDIALP